MYETPADLARLQQLLDRSHAAAGVLRGPFSFGSSPESVRFRQIARPPAVSAVHHLPPP